VCKIDEIRWITVELGWTEIEKYGMERVAGKLFAAVADEFGFSFVRNDTNKAKLYALK
jgi:hypothetical protein